MELNKNEKKKKDDEDDWELHPLFLSKIPKKNDIDKNAALSALITLINEEEEKEVYNYEPRRKNLRKKITERGEIIHKKDRRNMFEPYQNYKDIKSFDKKNNFNKDNLINDNTQMNLNVNNNIDQNINYIQDDNNISNPDTTNNTRKDGDETTMGELLVCLNMINLK
ncbi:hypothetical protein PGSY75_0915900 [Plasmodium gaboni]|uniref:Uncharacterized protein n=1 Tax=Plasmodium gaboni TaxID=647221 RepID=A0A151LM07_9APIC|nr:hypothetical protein PGSY75_0915900 [Plasmodium gaboni]KYO00147.1 hypothetical protein PGSY75_0915900 [Plasmodium gaboni]